MPPGKQNPDLTAWIAKKKKILLGSIRDKHREKNGTTEENKTRGENEPQTVVTMPMTRMQQTYGRDNQYKSGEVIIGKGL